MTTPDAPATTPLGLFGGTFDPVHFGHLRLAEEAAEALGLARIRWIPAGQPLLRETPQADAGRRLEMVRLAIAGNPRFELDAAEVEDGQPSYTVHTLERLRRAEVCGAARPLVLLLGADAFAGLSRWRRWEDVLELAHLGVAHRPGYPLDVERLTPPLAAAFRRGFCADPAGLADAPGGRIATFAMTPLDISATMIRARLSKGESVRYLTPEAVAAYAQDHRLYYPEN